MEENCLVMQPVDILILSNGPGEVTTWVRPVVKALRQQLGEDRSLVRISVVLSRCPNATGKEADIAGSYSEVDRVQSADYFLGFLLWGRTADHWDWRDHGVVLFLGGDQFFTVIIGKRLGYRTVVYAEWDARWYSLIDRFGVMKAEVITKSPKKYRHKLTVVGDLMADVATDFVTDVADGVADVADVAADGVADVADGLLGEVDELSVTSVTHPLPGLIGLLPGSKAAKLAQGVPLTLAVAEHIHAAKPYTRFVIPVAPTLDLATLIRFADPLQNPLIKTLGWGEAELIVFKGEFSPESQTVLLKTNPKFISLAAHSRSVAKGVSAIETSKYFLKTSTGLCIELWPEFPAHNVLSQCQLCLTTVGANTAELGSLVVPMIVLLPTQQLDAMRAWDGLPGILARLPGVGSSFAKLINWLVLRQKRLFAWPNIWAKAEIVPELVGKLEPQDVAQLVIDYLDDPEKLEEMRSRLRAVRGEPGAAQKLAELVREELN